MVSGIKSSEKSNIWSTIYAQNHVDVFKGKKQGNIENLLGSISILGESHTSDLAKFVKSYGKSAGTTSETKYSDYSKLQNDFSRLFSNRLMYTSGGKKILDEITKEPKRYSNPIDTGYVIVTETSVSSKGISTPKYFLTMKGFFLIMGYDLASDELKKVIDNASKISLFFCFIKSVMDNYNIKFIIEIFVKPIQKVLLRSDIFQGGSMDFYFGNFADSISNALSKKMRKIYEKRKDDINNKPESYFSDKITKEYMQLHPTRNFSDLLRIKKRDELKDVNDLVYHFQIAGIESLMQNVFYSSNPKEDWYDSLVDHFYPNEESKKLFLKFGYDSEINLMVKVMQSISLTYSYFEYGLLPYREKKLPRSKAWKRHQKFKKDSKHSKSIREFDLSNL
jgi:hypothetical protein